MKLNFLLVSVFILFSKSVFSQEVAIIDQGRNTGVPNPGLFYNPLCYGTGPDRWFAETGEFPPNIGGEEIEKELEILEQVICAMLEVIKERQELKAIIDRHFDFNFD